MDEKRKFILTILLGMAGLFLLTTRFALPMIEDNKKHKEQFTKLKAEVDFLESFKKGELDSIEEKMDKAINNFEVKIPPKGKLKLTEHLTRASLGENIVLKAIEQGVPQETEDYQIIPVDVTLKAPFDDFIDYLAAIEASSLFIDVNHLTIQKVANEPDILDIEATFSGFKLTHQFPPLSKFLNEKYEPLDMNRLNKLFETVQSKDTKTALLDSKDYNPFASAYDFVPAIAPEEVVSAPVELLEEEEIAEDLQDLFNSLTLRGVLNIGEEKAALINDTIVKKGEKIADMNVVEIQEYRVILMHSDRRRGFTLKMGVDSELFKP